MSLKLYYASKTRATRVLWTLEELEQPYELIKLDLQKGEHKTESYRKINPFMKVPAIDDNGKILIESGAICLYLAEKYGKIDSKIWPEILQWSFFACSSMEIPAVIAIKNKVEGKALFDPMASVLETMMTERMYITGDEFNVADILLVSVLNWVKSLSMLDNYPQLLQYMARSKERPSFQKVLKI